MQLKSTSILVAAAILSIYSFGLLYEGFVADRYAALLTSPFVDKTAALRAYDRLPPDASAADREFAAQRLIRADPANPQTWDAVGYVDWLKHGRLTADGVRALDRSYALSFFDRTGAVWRIGFALDNWAALTPQLRGDVAKEATVALKDPELGPQLRQRLAQIRSPEGRLAADLIVADE